MLLLCWADLAVDWDPDLEEGAARLLRTVFALFFAIALVSGARSEPVSSLAGMWRTIRDCTNRAAGPPEAVGSEFTVLFTMKRDGSLQGQPRITYSHLLGDQATQQAFFSSVLAALARCFPMPLTEGLGGAIAGRPLRLRIVHRPREHAA